MSMIPLEYVYGKPTAFDSAPFIQPEGESLEDEIENVFTLDEKFQKMKELFFADTAPNREFAFYNDGISVSYVYIFAATVFGRGGRLNSGNTAAARLIKDWSSNVNVSNQTLEDVIEGAIFDGTVHKEAVYRILHNQDYEYKADISRVPMWSLMSRKSYPQGYKLFVQEAYFPKATKNMTEFINDNSFTVDPFERRLYNLDVELKTVIMPKLPTTIINFELFQRAPVSYSMHVMHYKRWILDFMYKTAKQYWNPFKVGYVGDPKSGWQPETPPKFKKEIHKLLVALLQSEGGSALSLPGYMRVELLESKKTKADEFGTFIEVLNNEIMMYMMSSMGLRQAAGTELAVNRSLMEMWLRYVEGKRRKIITPMKWFWSKSLCPMNGITVPFNDLDYHWPQLRMEDVSNLAKAIQLMQQSFTLGIKERREAAQQIWEWIDPENAEELTELKAAFKKSMESPTEMTKRPAKSAKK